MGTDHGDIATETPPTLRPPSTANKLGIDPSRPKSLKRTREPTPPSLTPLHPGVASPSKLARLAGQTSRHSESPPRPAVPAVPASAILDSENGRWSDEYSQDLEKELASSIMASASAPVSHPQGTHPSSVTPGHGLPRPDPTSIASPSVPAAIMAPPSDPQKAAPSPQSTADSLTSLGGNGQVTTSPEAMDIDGLSGRSYTIPQAHMEERPTSSMSYPPIPTTTGSLPATPSLPQRTATHPTSASQDGAPRSPSSSSKKHKCQFCETEFTRHHNLKSHLLTHSHEKPYECQTCQMRFRRLHDLKRHSKLHTGEKPHICPKCDRKFARGDALARHSKGAGGCAGRRHSLPGFAGGEDDLDGPGATEGEDSVMGGVVYEGTNDEMGEQDRHHLIMANTYAIEAAGHARTYPPTGARTGGLYPPNADRSNSNPVNHAALATATLYAQNAMTESPKPLSPHSAAAQTSQGQNQQHASRRPSEGLSLPSSHSSATSQSVKPGGISGFAAPVGNRYTTGSSSGPATGHVAGSHSRNSNGPSIDSGNSFVSGEQAWSLISSLEERVKQLSERLQVLEGENDSKNAQISHLTSEMATLRQQLLTNGRQEATAPAVSTKTTTTALSSTTAPAATPTAAPAT